MRNDVLVFKLKQENQYLYLFSICLNHIDSKLQFVLECYNFL